VWLRFLLWSNRSKAPKEPVRRRGNFWVSFLLPFPQGERYKFCISTFGRTIESLEKKIHQARSFEPDLIELRLDFLRNLDVGKLESVRKFLKGNEVLTIRSMNEGGTSSALSELKRVELFHWAIAFVNPSFVDIEIQTLRHYPVLMKEIGRSRRTKLIASFHDLEETTNSAQLRKIISLAPLKSESLFAVKIVSLARKIRDNLEVLGLYSSLERNVSSRLVAFCTGRAGIPSRILCLYLGCPFSYASLPGEAVAAGQLDIRTMRRIVGTNTQ
jgi:3-dehydroquinate dehydratase-1